MFMVLDAHDRNEAVSTYSFSGHFAVLHDFVLQIFFSKDLELWAFKRGRSGLIVLVGS